MPFYEYRCKKCGERFEKLVRISTLPHEIQCPSCGEPEPERELSLFAAFGPTGGGCGSGGGGGGSGFS